VKRSVRIMLGILLAAGIAACAGGGSPTVRYSVGYGSYYGAHPWGYYPGRPVYIGGGGGYDIPDIPEGPVAEPLPDFGMPDIGGFDF